MKLRKFLGEIGRSVRRNKSTWKAAGIAVGVAGTGVLAAVGTVKAARRIETAEIKKGEPLTTGEKVVTALPSYIPAVATGLVVIGSVHYGKRIDKKTITALASGAGILGAKARTYYNELPDEIKQKLAIDSIHNSEIEIGKVSKPAYEVVTFHDTFSDRVFTSTREDLVVAKGELNRILAVNDWANLNTFYELMGLPTTPLGEAYGWCISSLYEDYNAPWLDVVDIEYTEDDVHVIDIVFPYPPDEYYREELREINGKVTF